MIQGRDDGACYGPGAARESLAFDAALNYQYRAFGVPGLGLKRGLAEDLVIAPYASALALMVAPEEACLNLERLAAEGGLAERAADPQRLKMSARAVVDYQVWPALETVEVTVHSRTPTASYAAETTRS